VVAVTCFADGCRSRRDRAIPAPASTINPNPANSHFRDTI
jgi:hypothetical protein